MVKEVEEKKVHLKTKARSGSTSHQTIMVDCIWLPFLASNPRDIICYSVQLYITPALSESLSVKLYFLPGKP